MSGLQLGDYRVANHHEEIYILVDGKPQWREFEWHDRADYLYLRNGRTPLPYWVPTPILAENEVLRETVEGPVEILTKPYSRLT